MPGGPSLRLKNAWISVKWILGDGQANGNGGVMNPRQDSS
jgi:hypothetical protein